MPIRPFLALSMEEMGCFIMLTLSISFNAITSMPVLLILSIEEVWQVKCCLSFVIMLPSISFIVITIMPMFILGIEEV